ncbi:50S ribosomal protein L29 [uncultured delta proteobacterium]|uniref:Large ribosomal subunit protein uL29 n=1 Tax=uncultured delta proteobacterium TaxID=34034 RepID=A0A212KES8_9DELT|nr:50S ribosomal protein L29 [uncultured delta proteobacterium]
MKATDTRKELANLSREDLAKRLVEARQDLFDLRFKHATGQLEKTAQIPAAKREVARILTYMKKGA